MSTLRTPTAMAELGTKHECYSCGAKFYDLGESPVICPKCETDQDQTKEPEVSEETSPDSVKDEVEEADND